MIDRHMHAAVEAAITQSAPLAITYVSALGERTERIVEPYDLTVTAAGNLIVRAMDRRSGAPRSFRLDRVELLVPVPGPCLLTRPHMEGEVVRAHLDDARAAAALERIRAEIEHMWSYGFCDDAMRWSPGDPIPAL